MDIFGISSAKIILILIIAILLLGPDQVPTIVKTVGKTIRDFRRFVNETTKEFNDVTGDLRKEFTDSVGDLRSELEATQAELKGQFDFSEIMNPITSAIRDPIGTMTAPTPDVSAFATATATLNEANPLATQTVAYTPPQPVEAFSVPSEPAPAPEPIVVQTSYAESLAAAAASGSATATSNAPSLNSNGDGNGHASFVGRRATKADPFADLVLLAPAAPAPALALVTSELIATTDSAEAMPVDDLPFMIAPDAPPTGLAAIPVGVLAGDESAASEPVSIAPAPTPITARRASVGGSVGGTKYGRKRA